MTEPDARGSQPPLPVPLRLGGPVRRVAVVGNSGAGKTTPRHPPFVISGHRSRRTVGILAVADDSNLDDRLRVVDRVNDPVVTDSDPPQVIATPQFPATSRSRLRGKRIDLPSDTVDDLVGQCLEFPSGRPPDPHLMHGGGLS
jgi:hypothetical protein